MKRERERERESQLWLFFFFSSTPLSILSRRTTSKLGFRSAFFSLSLSR